MRVEEARESHQRAGCDRCDGIEIHRHRVNEFLEGDVIVRKLAENRPDAMVGATL